MVVFIFSILQIRMKSRPVGNFVRDLGLNEKSLGKILL